MLEDFVQRFGGIYEHSPWVAEQAHAELGEGFVSLQDLQRVMAECVDNATAERQRALIRAHPDLAGKAQKSGELTADSTEEQSRAGIDQCSDEEYERFQTLNAAYKQKFEFPFVMAVRNSDRHQILDAFAARLKNDYDGEFEAALSEIHKIAALRITAMEHSQ